MSKATSLDDPPIPPSVDELCKLVKRAQKGDASTLPVLRKMLRDPSATGLLGGDLARQAERSLIETAAGDNLVFREALTRKLEVMRADLAGPNPTPVEVLLVERIVACWLQVQDADVRCAQAKNASLAWSEFLQRRMGHAHRRYLSAIKALATVRKMALPVLQVNIAKKQVNVVGLVAGPEGG